MQMINGYTGLSPDDALVGAYNPLPIVEAQASQMATSQGLTVSPDVKAASQTLIWWFGIFAVLIVGHVLTIKFQS